MVSLFLRVLVLTLAAVLSLSASAAPALVPPRAGTELFADDVDLAAQARLTRHTHAAERLPAPVIVADRPWEGGRVYIYGSVVRDAATGGFRMWYGSSNGGVLYATSNDGLHWTKPDFDVFPYQGHPTNRVWIHSAGASVLDDSADPEPSHRYKMIVALSRAQRRDGGFRGLYSADGIHWHEYPQYPLIPFGTEMGDLIRDPASGRYFAYVRPYWVALHPRSVREKRIGAVTTSADMLHWSPLRLTLTPDAIDDAWVRGPDQRTEFYAMNGFPYGRSYLGVEPRFLIQRLIAHPGREQSSVDGPLEGQLIVSRDGLDWHRLADREPVIPSGTDFDRSIMNVATAPVIAEDKVWLYYTGINTTHGGPVPPKRIAVCLARWRLDGLVSLDAGDEEGFAETVPIAGRTGELEVNADERGGSLRVEVLDEAGRPLPGYGREEGIALEGGSVRQPVKWRGHSALPPPPYRLRFIARHAALYSYTIGPSAAN
jgi:hypothetical protein